MNFHIVCAKMVLPMPNVDSTLLQEAKVKPQDIFRVIVRVQGDLDARQGQLEAVGFIIIRRLRLVNGYSASASGAAIHRVIDEEWIISVERDVQVHTMGTGR